VAYLHWFQGLALDEACDYVMRKRCCEPDKEAVRAATRNLLSAHAQAHRGDAHSRGGTGGLASRVQRVLGWGAAGKQADSAAAEQLTADERRAIRERPLGGEHIGEQPALPDLDVAEMSRPV
jgi:hypothetical protein